MSLVINLVNFMMLIDYTDFTTVNVSFVDVINIFLRSKLLGQCVFCYIKYF